MSLVRAAKLLPPRDLPAIDSSGRITEVWYEYFQSGIPTSRIVGNTTSDEPLEGALGEVLIEGPTHQNLTSAVTSDVMSITLPPGDWELMAPVQFQGEATTTVTETQCSITTVSGFMDNTVGYHEHWRGSTLDFLFTMRPGPVHAHISVTTTYYLVAQAIFSGGTYEAVGMFVASRHR